MLEFFTPVSYAPNGTRLPRDCEVRGRTYTAPPRYDLVEADGLTVHRDVPEEAFTVTGPPRAVAVIPWPTHFNND